MPIFDHNRLAFTPYMRSVIEAIRPGQRPITTLLPFDYESFLIQAGMTAPKLVCMSAMPMWAERPPASIPWPQLFHANFDRDALESYIRAALLDPATLLLGANVSFDLGVTANEFPHLLEAIFNALDENRVICVELAQRLIDVATDQLDGKYLPDGSYLKHKYNLAALAKRHLDVDMDKDTWRLIYGTLWNAPTHLWDPGAVDYSVGDSVVTGGVFQSQVDPLSLGGNDTSWRRFMNTPERVGADQTLVDIFRQTRAQFWLALMVARGIRVDPVMVASLKHLIERERDQVFARLIEAGLVDRSGKRNLKAAHARMTSVMNLQGKNPKTTAKGEIALDEDTCIESGDGLMADYASYTSLTTILSKDVGALEEPAAKGLPIQSRFETLLETGRTSCQGGKGKKAASTFGYQLQNPRRKLGIYGGSIAALKKYIEAYPTDEAKAQLKKIQKLDEEIDTKIGVRQCFIPRPGFVFSSNDFSMFELCTWSQVTVDLGIPLVRLIDALQSRKDVHLELGARVLGITYDEAVKRKKDTDVKNARQQSKPANFGFMGGLGWRSFKEFARTQYQVTFDDDGAKRIKRVWLETWEPQAYFDFIAKLVGGADMGEVIHMRSHRRRAWVPYTVAANSFFQGLAADCAKAAGYEITRECFLGRDRHGRPSPLEGSRVVNFVHDEFIAEHPIDLAHEAAYRIATIMEETSRAWMPDCPSWVEPALMTAWHKGAEARFGPDGKLVPWYP